MGIERKYKYVGDLWELETYENIIQYLHKEFGMTFNEIKRFQMVCLILNSISGKYFLAQMKIKDVLKYEKYLDLDQSKIKDL